MKLHQLVRKRIAEAFTGKEHTAYTAFVASHPTTSIFGRRDASAEDEQLFQDQTRLRDFLRFLADR